MAPSEQGTLSFYGQIWAYGPLALGFRSYGLGILGWSEVLSSTWLTWRGQSLSTGGDLINGGKRCKEPLQGSQEKEAGEGIGSLRLYEGFLTH